MIPLLLSSTLFPYTTLFRSAGADFVKTSTGFAPSGATHEDLALMRDTVSDRVQVKAAGGVRTLRSEEHTSELQSPCNLVCRLLLEKKKIKTKLLTKVSNDTC